MAHNRLLFIHMINHCSPQLQSSQNFLYAKEITIDEKDSSMYSIFYFYSMDFFYYVAHLSQPSLQILVAQKLLQWHSRCHLKSSFESKDMACNTLVGSKLLFVSACISQWTFNRFQDRLL